MPKPSRSYLFTPANHPRRVEKVFHCGADVAILDLEDAVAVAEKAAARKMIPEILMRPRFSRAYVRVNPVDTDFCFEDLHDVVVSGLDGIVLPKVETLEGLMTVEWTIRQLERRAGLVVGQIALLPIIETARGLANFEKLAGAGSRAKCFAFGAADFTFDLNITWTADERELDYTRSRLVALSRAAGIEAPIDTVWVEIRDLDGLTRSAERAAQMGFQGKLCIHPEQVPIVNRSFTPDDATIEFARRVVAAFASAEGEGSAALQVDGKFIDYPIVYRAQRILDSVE